MDALSNLDAQLYLAITTSRVPFTAIAALVLVALNFYGFLWYVGGFFAARHRGFGRRGVVAAVTVLVGLALPWIAAELLKQVVRRPRPFDALSAAPPTLQFHPSSYSFPSGDSALALGAAVALGAVFPRLRRPALLVAIAIAFSRIVVGVHYPSDVLAGALLGVAGGLLAPVVVARALRLLRWRVFVVMHTHWDREWYERVGDYRKRLVPMVTKLLALLERDEEHRSFTFDGQTIAIEDHLETKPEDRPRIEALVRADRLFVGPWYVLADLLLVSGESLVRNFQEGLRSSAELGRACRVAYVADPFGHPAQIPQLLRGFGYDTYVFARGIGDEGDELGSEFLWQAPSGDRVIASHQVAHYDNALPLVGEGDETPEALRARVRRVLPSIFDRTAPYANSNALLFMVGDDHTEPYERLPEALRAAHERMPRLDMHIAGLEEFAAALPRPTGVFSGELVSGKYRPILRGVNSTRVWIKQANARCERLLLEVCEPLDAGTAGAGRTELRALWRLLLQNHPHDSICGCSIDAVHDLDMAPRFERVERDGRALAERLIDALGGGDQPMLFDPVPWSRDAVVPVDGRPTLVRAGGVGMRPLSPSAAATSLRAEGSAIQNEHLRVEVARDGSFVILDLASGERSGTQNRFSDDGDRGDEYTHSYCGPTVDGASAPGTVRVALDGDRAVAAVELVLSLPRGLRPDRLARDVERVACPVRVVISLDAGARRVDVATTIVNHALDHRLRALFDTCARTVTHTAGAAFAWLERPNRIPHPRGWIEPPTETRCAHELVAVRLGERGLAVGLDGLREYAVLGDGATIAITLMRCMGWLNRSDLPERPIAAGPDLETPSAQCPGEQTFRYAVVPLSPATSLPAAARAVREWLSPPLLVRGDGNARPLLSLDALEGATFLSALRSGGQGKVVVRLVNPTKEPALCRLRLGRPVVSAQATDLREDERDLGNTGLEVVRTAAPAEVVDGDVVVRLQPFEIGTWSLALSSYERAMGDERFGGQTRHPPAV